MGVKGLWQLISHTGRPIKLESLSKKRLAVDASIWLYQFIKAMRDPSGKMIQGAHLIGFFKRICKLLYYGIKPIFVFDGAPPELKKQTMTARKTKRLNSEVNLKQTASKILSAKLKLAAIDSVTGKSKRTGADHDQLNKRQKLDEFHLPEDGNDINLNDPRFVTENELLDFIQENSHKIDLSLASIESSSFKSLPPEVQHSIILDLKLQSRQPSKERLDTIVSNSKDALDFSKNQIEYLVKRNYLTEKSMQVAKTSRHNGLENNAADKIAKRVAGVRNRQFALIKDNDTGGYSMRVKSNQADDLNAEKLQDDTVQISSDSDGSDIFEFVTNIKSLDSSADKNKPLPVISNSQRILHPVAEDCKEIILSFEENLEERKGISSTTHSPHETATSLSPLKHQLSRDEFLNYWILSAPSSIYIDLPNLEDMLERAVFSCDISEIADVINSGTMRNQKTADNKSISFLSQFLDELCDFNSNSHKNNDQVDLVEEKKTAMDSRTETERLSDMNRIFIFAEKESEQSALSGLYDSRLSGFEFSENRTSAVDSISVSDHVEKKLIDAISPDKQEARGGWTNLRTRTVFESINFSEHDEKKGIPLISPYKLEAGEDRLNLSAAVDIINVSEHDEMKRIPVFFPDMSACIPDEYDSHHEDTLIRGNNTQIVYTPLEPVLDDECRGTLTSSDPSKGDDDPDISDWLDQNLEVSGDMEEENAVLDDFFSKLHPAQNSRDIEMELDDLMSRQKREIRDASDVNSLMMLETQELIKLFGLPYMVSPSEAESQCAFLVEQDIADGVITDDSDIFLFGGTHVYRHFFNQQKYCELFRADDLKENMKLDRDRLIRLAYLLGSDYTPGLKGLGPVTSLEILREWDSCGIEGLIQFKDWAREVQNLKNRSDDSILKIKLRKAVAKLSIPDTFPDTRVYEAYTCPLVNSNCDLFTFSLPNAEKLRRFMMDKVGWSESKTDQILLPLITEMKKQSSPLKQTTIQSFYPRILTSNQAHGSKRVQEIISKWDV